MGEPRPEKVAVVDEVRDRLSSSNGALLTEYRGLKVADLAALRRSVGEAGGEYKIYKNTLVRRAAADLSLTELEPLLVGPTAIAFVDGDAVAVAKSLRDFARTNPNLVIKGGLLGDSVLSAGDAGALADVAPREVVSPSWPEPSPPPSRRWRACSRPCPATSPTGCPHLSTRSSKKKGTSRWPPRKRSSTASPA